MREGWKCRKGRGEGMREGATEVSRMMKGSISYAVTAAARGVQPETCLCMILCREPRLRGDVYFDFMDEVVDAIQVTPRYCVP